MDLPLEISRAERRIRRFLRETPLDPSPSLSERTGAKAFVKLENRQHTGSFKARGALNKILSLSPARRSRGVVAASTGNHGAAVGYALGQVGAKGVVFAPETAAAVKLEAIERHGLEIRVSGDDALQAELAARAYAKDRDMTYISPYNDPDIVAGQGTVGVELARQLDPIDAVFVALGGGGLISGIGGFLKWLDPKTRVIACSPERSPAMHDCLMAGRIIETPCRPTLSDGTAGGVEPGAITFELCRTVIDEHVLIGEDQIRDAMRLFIEGHGQVIEGAAGVAVAGLLQSGRTFAGKNTAVIICGGNISPDALKAAL